MPANCSSPSRRGRWERLEDLACWLAARLGSAVPAPPRCEIFIFAADHGVAARGGIGFPRNPSRGQMVGNFANGGAAINVLASLEECRIEVIDVGVASDDAPPAGVRNERVRAGTRDLTTEAALTADELRDALAVGARYAQAAVSREARLLIAGDMGIANSTAAACLICAFTGAAPESVVGRGTGVDDTGLARKLDVVRIALARVAKTGAARDASQMLAELGGSGDRCNRRFFTSRPRGLGVPVMLDG